MSIPRPPCSSKEGSVPPICRKTPLDEPGYQTPHSTQVFRSVQPHYARLQIRFKSQGLELCICLTKHLEHQTAKYRFEPGSSMNIFQSKPNTIWRSMLVGLPPGSNKIPRRRAPTSFVPLQYLTEVTDIGVPFGSMGAPP